MSTGMSKNSDIEYSVYTFGGKKNGKRKANWHKHMTSEDMHKALEEAEKLFESNKFGRIEVKKKYYDSKNSRTVDMAIKVFEKKPKKTLNIPTIIIGGIILAVVAFAITYYVVN